MRLSRILLTTAATATLAVATPYAVAYAQTGEDGTEVTQTDGDPDEILQTTAEEVVDPCEGVTGNLPTEPGDGVVTDPGDGGQVDPAPGEEKPDEPVDEPVLVDPPQDEPAVEPAEEPAGDPDQVFCIAMSGPVMADTAGNAPEAAPAAAPAPAAPVAKPVKARASFTG